MVSRPVSNAHGSGPGGVEGSGRETRCAATHLDIGLASIPSGRVPTGCVRAPWPDRSGLLDRSLFTIGPRPSPATGRSLLTIGPLHTRHRPPGHRQRFSHQVSPRRPHPFTAHAGSLAPIGPRLASAPPTEAPPPLGPRLELTRPIPQPPRPHADDPTTPPAPTPRQLTPAAPPGSGRRLYSVRSCSRGPRWAGSGRVGRLAQPEPALRVSACDHPAPGVSTGGIRRAGRQRRPPIHPDGRERVAHRRRRIALLVHAHPDGSGGLSGGQLWRRAERRRNPATHPPGALVGRTPRLPGGGPLDLPAG